MRMSGECLTPRVEYSKKPQLGTEMLGISGDDSYGLGGRPKQEVVHRGFVLCGHRRHVVGHGEDDVEVLDVENVLHAVVDPGGAFQRLTLGTMPIRAGVIGDALVATGIARFDMTAEDGGAARLDR